LVKNSAVIGVVTINRVLSLLKNINKLSSLNPIGTPFIELPTVGSTNNYAMGLVREGMAQHGTAVFAHEQTMGKGQRNREWKSIGGQNIALSIIIEPRQSAPAQIFLLSKTIALATHQFVNSYVKDQVSIKWPNDIYWRDRQAAGILIENIWQGREWKSLGGQNIAISFIIEPGQSAPSQIFLLSKAIALATHQFVKSYVKDQVSIKWPNDIYWRDRKAAGILIENIWQGKDWKYAIAGIGININQEDFDELGKKAVSFKQITGLEYEPLILAKELCGFIEKEFNNIHEQPEKIEASYKAALYKLNEKVKLKKDNRVFEAWIRDVTNEGELVVQHAIMEQFSMGEIEWVV
jgi:BirA family biotin operon repressor/biotin-[acetyl-CoA-carboxylase] ligase